jgi:hypothetical protein
MAFRNYKINSIVNYLAIVVTSASTEINGVSNFDINLSNYLRKKLSILTKDAYSCALRNNMIDMSGMKLFNIYVLAKLIGYHAMGKAQIVLLVTASATKFTISG